MRRRTPVGLLALALASSTRAVPWEPEVLVAPPTGPFVRAQADVGDLDGDGFSDQVWVVFQRAHVWLGGRGRTTPEQDSEAHDWADEYTIPDQDWLSLAPAGDVDADGHADFALGVFASDPKASPDFEDVVVVRHGAERPMLVEPYAWVIGARFPGTFFGRALAAGDVNGDGFTDLAISAPGNPEDPLAFGRVQLHLGSPRGLEAREAWTMTGPVGYGIALAIVDHDGDGLADLLVGGPEGVERFRGHRRADDDALDTEPLAATGDLLTTTPVGAPRALAAAGDLDADGLADAILGDPIASRIELLFGTRSGDAPRVESVATRAHGCELVVHPMQTPGAASVVAAGDLDGDGRTDLALAAKRLEGAGDAPPEAFVLFGGDAMTTTPAVPVGDLVAYELYAIGDYDDDGLADLRLDRSTIVFGATTAIGPPRAVQAADLAVPLSRAPRIDHVACAGDVNGDGFDDLVVTSLREDGGGCVLCARALLVHGGPGGALTPAFEDPGEPGDEARSSHRVGDVDGDGFEDVLVISELAPAGDAPNAGRATLYWGSVDGVVAGGKPPWLIAGAGARAHLGHRAAPAGDVDGDGGMDFALDLRATVNGPDAALFGVVGDAIAETARWGTILPAPEGLHRDAPTGLGDTNADGLGDLGFVVVDPTADPGRALHLQRGSPDGPSAPTVIDVGPARLDLPHPVGDLDGDGRADFVGLSGGRDEDPVVAAHVFRGAAAPDPELDIVVAADDARLEEDVHRGLPMAVRAGDVDGDGRDDLAVVVPARGADLEGRIAVFRGTEAGLVPSFEDELTLTSSGLGPSVAGACDLNGDRFADLVARVSSAPEAHLVIYDGNGALGHDSAFAYGAVAIQPDTRLPIAPGGRSRSPTSFGVSAHARSPFGPARIRLEVEVERHDVPFDGKDLVVGDFVPIPAGLSIPLPTFVDGLVADEAYHWRARLGYDRTQAPLLGHSRWFGPSAGPVWSGVHVRTRTNRDPVATDDVVFATDGVIVLGATDGVLVNDLDPDGDALAAELLTPPEHGTLATFGADGGFAYIAESSFRGIDHFTYASTDGFARVEATVTVVADACARCERGDYFVAVRTTSGALRSIRCWVDADDGEPECATDATGALLLGEPRCE